MKYEKTLKLKNGEELLLRNGAEADGAAVLDVFTRTHKETDNMLTYADETTFDAAKEGAFLQAKTDSESEIEILAFVNGVLVGTAGVSAIGGRDKIRHRAEFGVGILKAYWGLGIGRAMTDACIECARRAGYLQFELEVVAENARAIALYEKCGFVEYGRNPRGFRKRGGEYQELVYMRLEL